MQAVRNRLLTSDMKIFFLSEDFLFVINIMYFKHCYHFLCFVSDVNLLKNISQMKNFLILWNNVFLYYRVTWCISPKVLIYYLYPECMWNNFLQSELFSKLSQKNLHNLVYSSRCYFSITVVLDIILVYKIWYIIVDIISCI